MERLYCPECGNYLEGCDGSIVDCHCGWKQERSLESDEDEIEQLRQRVAELEQQRNEFVKACDALLEWDFVRGFRLPYKVRDPIISAVVTVKGR